MEKKSTRESTFFGCCCRRVCVWMREFSVSMADYERWTVEQDEKNNGGDKPSVNIHIYTQADHPVCTAAAAALHTWPGIIMLMLENEVSHETKQHTHTHSLDSVTVSVIFFFFCIRLSAFGPHCVRAFIHGQRQGMCNIWFYVPCHHYLMYIFIHLFCFSLSLLFFSLSWCRLL